MERHREMVRSSSSVHPRLFPNQILTTLTGLKLSEAQPRLRSSRASKSNLGVSSSLSRT